MSKAPRKQSESDIYHVFNRGVSHCIIFEDDEDRRMFLKLLSSATAEFNARLHAWCLMDNHYHLLLEVPFEDLSALMHAIDRGYAVYFNSRHGRDGRLFGGPFKSDPIDSDEHFITVLRYIHQNPEKAGIAETCDYPWSSYREYVGSSGAVYRGLTSSLFSNLKSFCAFHEIDDNRRPCIDIDAGEVEHRISGDDALSIARGALVDCSVEDVVGLSRKKRDEALRALKSTSLSVRQIARLTGVPKSTVSRA